MKCISLWQPWASLWCSERKVHETRHWPIKHLGWLAVHAAKKDVSRSIEIGAGALLEILCDEYGGHWARDLPRGAIIGAVSIIDCVPTETIVRAIASKPCDDEVCGDFSAGRFAWKRGEFKLFERPVSYKGMQGVFEVDDNLLF
jgi:activating signal cointegrator 1